MKENKVITLKKKQQEWKLKPKQDLLYNYELDDLYPKMNEFMRKQLLEMFTHLSEKLVNFQYGEITREEYLNDVTDLMDIHTRSIKEIYKKYEMERNLYENDDFFK